MLLSLKALIPINRENTDITIMKMGRLILL